ncbi:MAG: YlxR family protein [Labilithrix sp.]|nr:YlxR family protein [Labilithrix sp.]MCW5816023.1 YlxR family protein [Labilithrix sp.]
MTHDDSAKTAKKRTERTCAGCGKHAEPHELVRVVLDPSSGELAVDMAGSAFGRGAHVHGAPDCLKRALKSGLSRAFKQEVKGDAAVLGAAIVEAADRRIEGLLSGAKRAGQLAIGADAVSEVEAPALIVVARDAAAAAKLSVVERAVAAGNAIAFAEKSRIGALLGGRDGNREVAILAILHAGVGAAVGGTYRLSAPFRKVEEAWSSSEVR